jgi:hypothetical protein
MTTDKNNAPLLPSSFLIDKNACNDGIASRGRAFETDNQDYTTLEFTIFATPSPKPDFQRSTNEFVELATSIALALASSSYR